MGAMSSCHNVKLFYKAQHGSQWLLPGQSQWLKYSEQVADSQWREATKQCNQKIFFQIAKQGCQNRQKIASIFRKILEIERI